MRPFPDHAPRIMDPSSITTDPWILDPGLWILVHGFRIVIFDTGP